MMLRQGKGQKRFNKAEKQPEGVENIRTNSKTWMAPFNSKLIPVITLIPQHTGKDGPYY